MHVTVPGVHVQVEQRALPAVPEHVPLMGQAIVVALRPSGVQRVADVLVAQEMLPGVHMRARHVDELHDWLVGHGDGVQERPSIAQVSSVLLDAQRVVPGVHVARQLPATQVVPVGQAATSHAEPSKLQRSRAVMQRVAPGVHSVAVHTPAAQRCPVGQAVAV